MQISMIMRHVALGLLMLVCGLHTVMAQSQGFSYQAVIRDLAGDPSVNTAHTLEFEIRAGSEAGPSVYAESHAVTTNAQGLVTTAIGKGSVVSGVFGDIDWAGDRYFLAVTIDGSAAGVSEFEAVPYAKAATNMDLSDLQDVSNGAPASGEVLTWDGSNWVADAPAATGGAWTVSGSTIYYDGGSVFIGGSSSITSAEYFGVRTPVSGNAYGGMYMETASEQGRPFYGYATDGSNRAWTYWDGADSTWKLYNNGLHFSVARNGNVGIGTTDPQEDLHVDGGLLVNSAAGNLQIVNGVTNDGWRFSTINGGDDLQLFEQEGSGGSTRRMLVEQGGYTNFFNGSAGFFVEGIRFANSGTNNNVWTWYPSNGFDRLFLAFNGTQQGYFDGTNGAYIQTSDRSLKRDIQTYAPVLDKVMSLRPYTYHYKHNTENDARSLGFVAQEVAADFPELVVETSSNGETDGTPLLGVNYSGFSVVAIKAIQEQQEVIEQQQQLIEALMERVTSLEQIVNE